jgi:hypothetical protein
MNKFLAVIATIAAAAFTLQAKAASHAGAAPMKASEPAAKADMKKDAAKKDMAAAPKKASEPAAKADAKKDEKKK